MKTLSSVCDISLEQLGHEKYELALFCSGFESRGSFFAEKFFDRKSTSHIEILGFDNERDNANRLKNDDVFQRLFQAAPIVTSASDDQTVLNAIRSAVSSKVSSKAKTIRLLVDISSMSRIWYATVLNWARFAARSAIVEIDFVYCTALHQADYAHRVISTVKAIPGCEGYPGPRERLTAVFGLGRDGLAPLALLDEMEPDDVLGFAVGENGRSEVDEFTRSANQTLLEACRECVAFPLLSVQQTYVGLLEMLSAFLDDSGNVVVVPLGPKSHVLSTILVAIRKPEIGCLHIAGNSTNIVDAAPSGDVAVVRVQFT